MKHIPTILKQYTKLFTTASMYAGFVRTGWAPVLGFFFFVHICIAITATTVFYVRSLPHTIKELQKITTVTRPFIPNETLFSWNAQEEKLTISNTDTPIMIPSDAYKNISFITHLGSQIPKYAVILGNEDSKAESLLQVTETGITLNRVALNTQTQFEFSLLPQFQDSFEVDGSFLFSYLDQSIQRAQTIAFNWWPLVLILAFPLVLLFTLANVLLDAFFIILLVKINQFRLTIAESVRLSVLIAAVAATVNQLAVILYPTISWPFYTIAFWLTAIFLLLVNKRLWL